MSAPFAGRRVRIDGLTSKPELNGQVGVAIGFDDAKCRYTVRLSDGRSLALKPAALLEVPGQSPGGDDSGGGDDPLGAILAELRGLLPGGPMHAGMLGLGALYVMWNFASLGTLLAAGAAGWWTVSAFPTESAAAGGGVRGAHAAVRAAARRAATEANTRGLGGGVRFTEGHALAVFAIGLVLAGALPKLLAGGAATRGRGGSVGGGAAELGTSGRLLITEIRSLDEFDALIAHHEETTGLPVVFDFYSRSCGPCRMIAPLFARLAREYDGRAAFAKVDQGVRDVFGAARIRSMPTFHFYLAGRRRHEFAGASEGQLRKFTDKLAEEAARANVRITRAALGEFYATHAPRGSAASDTAVGVYAMCADAAAARAKSTNSPGTGGCDGPAATELARRLLDKYGAEPALSKRFQPEPPAMPPAAAAGSPVSAEDTAEDAPIDPTRLLRDASRAELEQSLRRIEAAEAAAALAGGADPMDGHRYLPPAAGGAAPIEKLVVVGGGPAGLSAALYAARAGLSPVVVAPAGGGALLGKGVTVENFPGITGGVTGPGVVERMRAHCREHGVRFAERAVASAAVLRTQPNGVPGPFALTLDDEGEAAAGRGAVLSAQALVIATGADARWLGVEGEHTFRGSGVSSCATCDGFLFRDQSVVVVGGGDAAMEARPPAHQGLLLAARSLVF